MRLLEGYSTLYTSLSVRVSRIGAKLVYLSITSKQAKVAPEGCHGVRGGNGGVPLQKRRLNYKKKKFTLCLKIRGKKFRTS